MTKKIVNLGYGIFTKLEMNAIGVTEDSVGIELDEYAVKQTKAKNPDCNIIRADVRFLPLKNKAFNYALCTEVIEHLQTLKDATQLADELKRVSKVAVLTTPNSGFKVKIRDPTHYLFFTKCMLEKTIGKEWKIYTTSKTLPKLLAHLVPYESPKLGFLRRFFRKLDYMLEFSRLNRLSLWFFKGAILIAVTTTPKETN